MRFPKVLFFGLTVLISINHSLAFVRFPIGHLNLLNRPNTPSFDTQLSLFVPPTPIMIAGTLIPSSLGLITREYGVSYGYGFSMAIMAALARPFSWHSILHIIYGLRLATFLFVREVTVPYFSEMKLRIEQKGPKRWTIARFAFILQCAMLYWCMSCPVLLTTGVSEVSRPCLIVASLGLMMQVVGDTQKYIAKTVYGEGLVTSGIFRFVRHPNYTGEMILWSGSTLAGLLSLRQNGLTFTSISLSVASLVGLAGIVFVLRLATRNLDKKQKEKYGGRYSKWNAWI